MASLSDILTAIQNGVVAVNGLTQQIGTLFGLINPRRKLTAATTFYIGDGTGGVGNDANSGTSPSAAWLTFAHAMAVITGQIDFGGQTVTLQAVAGHAAFTTQLHILPWVGGGAFIYDGGGGSINISGNGGAAILDDHIGTALVQNVTLSSSSVNNDGQAIDCNCSGTLVLGAGLVFGSCKAAHMRLRNDGGTLFLNQTINLTNRQAPPYTISGGADSHIQISTGTGVFEGGSVTISNVTTFTSAFLNMFSGIIFASANWNATSQTVHGSHFIIRQPAVAFETGIGSNLNSNFFPGDQPGQLWPGSAP